MKRWFAVICLVPTLILTACIGPGVGDWHYELPNGYEIGITNPSNAQIVASGNFFELHPDTQVESMMLLYTDDFAARTNGHYILAMSPADSSSAVSVEFMWFIENLDKKEIYGPYKTEISFQKEILRLNLNIEDFGAWIPTKNKGRIWGHVSEFCVNDQYVCAKRVDWDRREYVTANGHTYHSNNYWSYEPNNPANTYSWYIVDTEKDILFGPYGSTEEFNIQAEKLGITNLGRWKSTRFDPNGFRF
jgi:hypothetical protein